MPKFVQKPVVVEAVRVDEPMTIETIGRIMRAEPRDWVVTVEGQQYVYSDYVFRKMFKPIDQEAKQMYYDTEIGVRERL